jgi:UDP-N-acetylglucosamine 1-carboxyvinyltransferase
MSALTITGGLPLCGTVAASGSKNAALPMMAAAILADAPLRLLGVPLLSDVETLAQVLAELGVTIARHGDCLQLEAVDPRPVRARDHWVRRMRASFCVLGPLLARRRKAIVPLPGGCRIGARPVDLHLRGLAALGAELRIERGCVIASTRRLRGTEIDLAGPQGSTATGTANVLTAAVLARGRTVLRSAAIEPEIVDLGRLLVAMGARIDGLGTACLEVTGVESLGGADYSIIPDRIEAATLLMAAAVTGGSVTVENVVPEHLTTVLAALTAAGADLTWGRLPTCQNCSKISTGRLATCPTNSRITLCSRGRLRAVDLMAEPYPGVPTDVQAQWTALMALADGQSRIADRVFPTRFGHVAELVRLGADITTGPGCVHVRGVRRLSGATVAASDLRASAALVLAALAAEGQTIVRRIRHLDRGYEALDRKLQALGAQVVRGRTAASPTVGTHKIGQH